MSSGNDVINGTAGDDAIDAGAGNDTIHASIGIDTIDGGDGTDTFIGNFSAEYTPVYVTPYSANWGLNTSTLYNIEKFNLKGGSSADVLTGGEFNDTLFGNGGNDVLDGGTGGNDSLNGGEGDDVLITLGGADTLNGGSETDTALIDYKSSDVGLTMNFSNVGGSVTFSNGLKLQSIEQINYVAGSGNDIITDTSGNDTIDAGSGDDVVSITGGMDYVDGGYGDDTLIYNGASDGSAITAYYAGTTYYTDRGMMLVQGFERFQFTGSAYDDSIIGGSGMDTLKGGNGNDTLLGGTGGDNIDGGAGIDVAGVDMSATYDSMDLDFSQAAGTMTLADGTVLKSIERVNFVSGNGDDTLRGTANDDTLSGGNGNDTVIVGAGYDYVDGGDGTNTLVFNGAAETEQVWATWSSVYWRLGGTSAIGFTQLQATGGSGDDYLAGWVGDDTLIGNDGADYISAGAGNNIVDAGEGNDIIDTGDGTNTVTAGAGDDVVYTGNGADTVTLDAGNDYYYGAGGDDTVTGGAGDDYIDMAWGEADTVIYSGDKDDYTITYHPDYPDIVTIRDNRPGAPDGTDQVLNADSFVFNGVTYTRDELGAIEVPCFVPGTMILTPDGERAVETLKIGDLVATADCTALPIKWIGRRRFEPPFSSLSPAIAPVLIRAGALGHGLPKRDLMVSPCHAMLIDGVFVAARDLVDGIGIQQWFGMPEVQYLHIEFEQPEAIFAEGALTESYVDHGNRAMYENAAEYTALYGAVDPAETRARRFPLVSGQEELERLRARLVSRTGLRRAA